MHVIITRANAAGGFDTVGTFNRRLIRNVRTEDQATREAIRFAGGAAYRIEFFVGAGIYCTPVRTLEQAAFPFVLGSRSDSRDPDAS